MKPYNLHNTKTKFLIPFYTLVLSFISSFCFSQGEVALIDLKMRKPEMIDVLNQEKSKVFCFLSSRELQLSVVNTNYNYSSAVFKLDKEIAHSDYVISTRDNAFHTLYYFNAKQNAILACKIDLAMGTAQTVHCGLIPKEEDFLTAVAIDDKVYILTVSKMSSTIHLWESYRASTLEKKSFETSQVKLHKTFELRDEELNEKKYSSIGIDKINYGLENNLKSAHAQNKLYVVDKTIILTIDDPDKTWIYTIDPVLKTLNEKTFSFRLEKGEGSRDKQGNSFLYNKSLFRTTINNEMINLSMIDIDSAKLYWTENIFPDQPIGIKNGPMVSEEDGKERILAKTQQYFNRVLNGKICIAVNEINDQYLIQVGSYEYKDSWGSPAGGPSISVGMGMGMGYSPMGMGMGYGWGMPGYYGGYPGYYPNTSYSYIQTTYFYALIDAVTLAHLPIAPPQTMRERLKEFEAQKFKKTVPDLIQVAPLENKDFLIGYYVKSVHKYQLIEIR